jgi:hypothetical protein
VLDRFEAAAADLLADRIGTDPTVQAVVRPRDELPALVPGRARVTVRVADGTLGDALGQDLDERLGPRGTSLRTTLGLGGRLRVTVEVGAAPAQQASAQRSAVRRAADAVLVALHDPDVRGGRVFGDAHEQGFAIDRLRLVRVEEPPADPDPATAHRRLEIWCEYAGRFWPTEPLAEGGVIEEPARLRMAFLDADLPTGLRARGGGPDLRLPVAIDLRTWGGAPPRLVARLAGAAPPATLVGDAAEVPAGSVGYLPDAAGRYAVVLRPAAVTSAARARVQLALASASRPTVRIGEVAVEVLP